MKRNWLKFQPKALVGVFLALMIYLEWRRGYFRGLGSHLKAFSWKYFPVYLLLAAAATLCLFSVDAILLDRVQSFHHPFLDIYIRAGAFLGKSLNYWPILLGLYFLAWLFRSTRMRDGVFSIFFSSALTSLTVHLLKFVFLRARPYGERGPISFFNGAGLIQDERVFQSLPSGDVALVAGAAGLIFFWFKNKALSGIVFLFPLATALSRMTLNKHWPSDTFVSLCIGLFMGYWVCQFKAHQNRD